jgi:hypothetical protein
VLAELRKLNHPRVSATADQIAHQVNEGCEEGRRQAGRSIRFGSFSEEIPLNWNKWFRQVHRWLSIAFTVAVIINTVAVARGAYADWVGALALLPLALLLLTGLYLFVLPYAAKWRSG